MKRWIVAAALSAFACTPALAAKPTPCTPANMAKSAAGLNAMPDGPKRMAAAKTLAKMNADMSKGNMGGACKTYMQAQAAAK